MGKNKRGFNQDARTNKKVVIDNSFQNQVKLDSAVFADDDICGDMILPSKKRKTIKVKTSAKAQQPLTKKERRKLESVLDRKKKKEKRASLLDALSKVQIPDKELKMMISTTDMQNKRNKKKSDAQAADDPTGQPINMIKGANRKQYQQQAHVSDSSSDCEITSSEDEEAPPEIPHTETNATSSTDLPSENLDKQTASALSENSSKSDEKQVQLPSLLSSLKGGVTVERDENIQVARLKLPILGEEQQIIETISENLVTIICGETGSGKTTQVPQFLYEAGYTSDGYMIGITEPRRVAAISMSKRVAQELNLSEQHVSYQIRYEGNTTPDTCIKFLTDGVLLKEIQNDFMLERYRAIVIDEAHERSVYTDVLIGLLSRIVTLRHKKGKPLKLVIMSATLRVEDFRDNDILFKVPPPVLKIDSRQFPVTVHFNKRTPDDYMTEAFRKICKIHRQLPAGGILVFVTGKQEVHTLCRKLQRTFPSHPVKVAEIAKQSKSVELGVASSTESSGAADDQLPHIELDNYSALPIDEQAELEVDDSDDDMLSESAGENNSDSENKITEREQRKADLKLPLYVLPLYSLLNTKRQQKVFEPPPEGCRLCVIATNVAETSLTIPNIRYVVDTGKTKNKFYDKVTGVSTFRVTFTSQASANQRAGRAGRTGPGHCYRIYSSSVYKDEFEKFSSPEIVSRPVDDLLLQMKSMGIDRVVNFPFPTPPSEESLLAAEDLLVKLGALETVTGKSLMTKGQANTKITSLGKTMSMFPVAPRYAKMLALAHQNGLLQYIIALVSACSTQELFMEGSNLSELTTDDAIKHAETIAKRKTVWAGKGSSLLLGDVMVCLKAIGAAEYAGCTTQFCEENGLRYKAVMEIRKLRLQLTNIVNSVIPSANICVDPKMAPPTEDQIRMIRQIMLSGLSDRVARLNEIPNDAEPDVKRSMRNSYQSTLVEGLCFIHPSSVLNKKNLEYIIYQDIMEANGKVYLRGVTAIEPEWLPVYAPLRCKFSEPHEKPEPGYNSERDQVVCHMSSTYGAHSWQLPVIELPYPNKVEKFRYFAKAFLEGEVTEGMKKFSSNYLSSPTIMVKSWARLQAKTESLLTALYTKKVADRSSLIDTWRSCPTYLLAEVLEWLPQSTHDDVRSSWPPIDPQEIQMEDEDDY